MQIFVEIRGVNEISLWLMHYFFVIVLAGGLLVVVLQTWTKEHSYCTPRFDTWSNNLVLNFCDDVAMLWQCCVDTAGSHSRRVNVVDDADAPYVAGTSVIVSASGWCVCMKSLSKPDFIILFFRYRWNMGETFQMWNLRFGFLVLFIEQVKILTLQTSWHDNPNA